MAKLLLARHGETEWSKERRYQGHTDLCLSAAGLKQAERLRNHLVSWRIDAIYSSDLKRASTTASIIATGHSREVALRKELREIDFGQFEGLRFEEISWHYPEAVREWLTHNPEVRALKGESMNELAARVSCIIPRLERHAPGETVLIVAHGGSLQVLLCLLLGIGLEHRWQIRLDNASLTVVETYPEGAVLSLLNDVCHLNQEG